MDNRQKYSNAAGRFKKSGLEMDDILNLLDNSDDENMTAP